MDWVIGVNYNSEGVDPIGRNRKADLKDLGMPVDQVKTMHVYFVQGDVSEAEVKKACQLLSDSIIQKCAYSKEGDSFALVKDKDAWVAQVRNKPGVTDAVGESTRKGLLVLGVKGVERVEAAFTYVIKGKLSEAQVKKACEKTLANSLIQEYKYARV